MKHTGPEVRFYNHLSPRPRATDYKKNRWLIYSKDQALQYLFIQLPGQKRKYICLDLDYEMAGSRWMDEVMLEPTIVIINPENTKTLTPSICLNSKDLFTFHWQMEGRPIGSVRKQSVFSTT